MRTAVLGAGTWGTAVAWAWARAGGDCSLWSRRAEQAEAMRRDARNPDYLPEVELSASIRPTADLASAVGGAELVFMAAPSHAMRPLASRVSGLLEPGSIVVSLAKGLEADSRLRMSEVLSQELPEARVAVMSGPSFAAELVAGDPTAVVVASRDEEAARAVQEGLSDPMLRLYTQDDVVGVEMGGCFKNVVALAAGVVEGLGYGTNTMAALITRGLREMMRLTVAMGGREETLAGLSGLGDLVLTSMGGLSRNKRVGMRIAAGDDVDTAQRVVGQVAEGVRTVGSIVALAEERGVEVPIARMVATVLHEGRDPRRAIVELMTREPKDEFE